MRLLHGADAHAGLATLGRPASEIGSSLIRFADKAVELDVDLAVWSGDTFHTRRPGPAEIRQALAAVGILRRQGIPLLIGTGNHDGYGTVADPESHTLAWLRDLDLDGVYCLTQREVVMVPTAAGAIRVGHLPYPHKRTFATETDDPAEQVKRASAWANDEVVRLSEEGAELLVAHVSVAGARLGTETAMQMGWDTIIDSVVLEPFRYAALGHIHVQQQVADNAWYAGSPEYMSFEEEGQPKGWLLADLEPLGGVEPIPSGSRAVRTYDVVEGARPEIEPRSIVRLRFHMPDHDSADWVRGIVDYARESGADFVKVEVVEAATQRATRLPANEAIDLDPIRLLARWLETNRVPPEPATTIGREAIYSARNTTEADGG